MSHRFPSLAPQIIVQGKPARTRAEAPVILTLTRELPQISLPWFEIGLSFMLLLILAAA